MDWQTIAQTVLGVLVGSGVIGLVVKSIITYYLSKDIEKAKIEIQSKFDIEIERFKSELRIAEKEFEIRYGKMHEKRAEVIAELFKRLVNAKRAVGSFVSLLQQYPEGKKEEVKDEKGSLAADNLNAYLDYSAEVRLYLTDEIEKGLDKIEHHFRKAWTNFQVKDMVERQDPEKGINLWIEADKEVNELIPESLDKLKLEFRDILGIS